ncbi:hypothetical protein N3K66_001390 [Trichothecium roseum]|uniref:Uncharacterized protein n=1 Tax=Trichothecium roseum TaxID=47278 RepID=A0ACC0VEK8_9HYPO|nr:hypothetical protein N3K66_001390 [Trichothecium roseum]
MMTKFMTEVTAKFNPFSASAKPARLFLTHLPPNARSQGMKININTLAKSSTETSSLKIKFKDGKEMDFACDKISIKGVVNECDRHSRTLQKASDLAD